MHVKMVTFYFFVTFLLAFVGVTTNVQGLPNCGPVLKAREKVQIQFALNLEFFEAEFFLYGALGQGLDAIEPAFAERGPPPIGAQKANLEPLTRRIIEEFGYQEVGHLRAIITTVGGIPRPLYDLGPKTFAQVFDRAVGYKLDPPFNPYSNTVNYLLASYVIPYVGRVGSVGTIPNLANYTSRRGLPNCGPVLKASDKDQIQFALNLEFFEAEFFLYGALGQGLDAIEPAFAELGPPPIGAQKANLDPLTRRIIEEFGYQEVGHLRAIITTVGGIPRPLYDLSPKTFAQVFDQAIGYKLDPPFNPYSNTVNYLLASYVIPYVGLVGYVGTIPNLANYTSRRLVASLLGVESGQDAVIRTLLYEKAYEKVQPYNITVAEFTNAISFLRNELAMCGIRDEGLIVPLYLGAENRTESNILSADANSLSYARTPPQILRIIYGTGSEYKPGGFLPEGGNGKIARSYLDKFRD